MEMTDPRIDVPTDVLPREMLRAANDPAWKAGSAEPWIRDLVAQFVLASGARDVIEIGGFQGYTSAALARALTALPTPATLTVCEIDAERAAAVVEALAQHQRPHVTCHVTVADSHAWLPTLPRNSVDLAWIDGNHEQAHVARELELLWPALRVRGLALLHDVFGVCDLQRVVARFGGYSLDLPRLGPAGGLGIVQKRA